MKPYFLPRALTVVASAMFIWNVASLPCAAQDSKSAKQYAPPPLPSGPSKPAPRKADGHVDLSGMWIEKYGELGEDVAFRKPAPGRAAAATKYPSDALPYQAWAAKKARELFDAANTDPLLHCLPYGEPRIWGGPHPARLVQIPGELIILYERDTTYRIVPTDGSPHPTDLDPSWMGDSAGHWEGDTLVVDVIGFNDKSWLGSPKNAGEGSGTFHSDALHVTERITRPDFDRLNVQITNDDPKVFTKPWSTTWNMKLVPKERMYEDVTCSNEKDFSHVVPAAGK
jgi:hypothetical protein